MILADVIVAAKHSINALIALGFRRLPDGGWGNKDFKVSYGLRSIWIWHNGRMVWQSIGD